jgi:hypothetical protein
LTGEALAAALPRCGEVTVLAWSRAAAGPVPPETVESLLGTARRSAQVVVADVPRWFDAGSRAALAAADVALLVCPAEVRAVAAGQRVAEALRLLVDDVRLVARGPSPGALTGDLVAAQLGLPLAGRLDPEKGLAKALDRGDPPGRGGRGPLARLCHALLPTLLPVAEEAPA